MRFKIHTDALITLLIAIIGFSGVFLYLTQRLEWLREREKKKAENGSTPSSNSNREKPTSNQRNG